MNKDELKKILQTEKFNSSCYSLDDKEKDEALSLRFESGEWSVYYSERGLQTGKKLFESESSACEYFLREMRADPTTKENWKTGYHM